jgi:glycoprotein endo-alpha-1,2-mannosidase
MIVSRGPWHNPPNGRAFPLRRPIETSDPAPVRARRALILLAFVALLGAGAARADAATAIFYYPWYGTQARDGAYLHWRQHWRLAPFDIASNFYPLRGAYSSGDPRVIAAQTAEIAAIGVDELVTSWWGWGSLEDERLPALLRAARARHLRVGAHIEPYAGRTVESVGADIEHLRSLGITDFYVYRPLDFTAEDWAPLLTRLGGVRVLAQTPLTGFASQAGFDGIYTYDVLMYGGRTFARLCAAAHRLKLVCAPSVGPGYAASRATGDPRTKPRRRGKTYDAMWRAALHARADEVTITSYNEWNEGTQIEPASDDPPALGYLSYDGAYGLHGIAASRAYLARTACWVAVSTGALVHRRGTFLASPSASRSRAARACTATF